MKLELTVDETKFILEELYAIKIDYQEKGADEKAISFIEKIEEKLAHSVPNTTIAGNW